MSIEHKNLIGISDGNNLVSTGSKWEQRKGRDTDIYYYDEVDSSGELVAKYEVKESMSIYPPFGTTKSYAKVSL
jgi:hypothetical protein